MSDGGALKRLLARKDRAERPERTRPLLDRAWKVRLVRGAVLLILLAGAASGPLALLRGAVRTAGSSPQADSPVRGRSSASTGPQGFAELFVAAWLNQTDSQRRDALAAFYPGSPDLAGTRAGQLYAARTTTVAAEAVADGYWSVTVAADVLRLSGSSLQPVGTRYYAVGVREDRGQCVATALPAEVAAPRTTSLPKLAGGDFAPPLTTDPVADALTHFFAALLTGQGELSRYVTGDSDIDSVNPPPFAGVTLRGVTQPVELHATAGVTRGSALPPRRDLPRQLVRAEVAAVDQAGNTTVLDYALEITRQNDRWEVRRLLGAAPLSGLSTATGPGAQTTGAQRTGGSTE